MEGCASRMCSSQPRCLLAAPTRPGPPAAVHGTRPPASTGPSSCGSAQASPCWKRTRRRSMSSGTTATRSTVSSPSSTAVYRIHPRSFIVCGAWCGAQGRAGRECGASRQRIAAGAAAQQRAGGRAGTSSDLSSSPHSPRTRSPPTLAALTKVCEKSKPMTWGNARASSNVAPPTAHPMSSAVASSRSPAARGKVRPAAVAVGQAARAGQGSDTHGITPAAAGGYSSQPTPVKSSSAGQCRSHSSASSSVNRSASCGGSARAHAGQPVGQPLRGQPLPCAACHHGASQPSPSAAAPHLGPAVVGHDLVRLAKVELQVLVHCLACLVRHRAAARGRRRAAAGIVGGGGGSRRRRAAAAQQSAPQRRCYGGCRGTCHEQERALTAGRRQGVEHSAIGAAGSGVQLAARGTDCRHDHVLQAIGETANALRQLARGHRAASKGVLNSAAAPRQPSASVARATVDRLRRSGCPCILHAPLPAPCREPSAPLPPLDPQNHRWAHAEECCDPLHLLCAAARLCQRHLRQLRPSWTAAMADEDRSAPRVRATSISSMSQLLLAGWAMLADSCPECGVSCRRCRRRRTLRLGFAFTPPHLLQGSDCPLLTPTMLWPPSPASGAADAPS